MSEYVCLAMCTYVFLHMYVSMYEYVYAFVCVLMYLCMLVCSLYVSSACSVCCLHRCHFEGWVQCMCIGKSKSLISWKILQILFRYFMWVISSSYRKCLCSIIIEGVNALYTFVLVSMFWLGQPLTHTWDFQLTLIVIIINTMCTIA